MAFIATSDSLPVAARVWKKKPGKPIVPPVVPPPQPPKARRGGIQVYWKCGEDRWLARNPRTGEMAYLCDQFFIDLKKSGFYETSSTVNGKKVSKVIPNVLDNNVTKDSRGKTIKTAENKITINENVEGN